MAFINKDILGNFFVKVYKIFKHYQTKKAMKELRLRYPNSIILGNVSITPDCKLGNHTVIHPGIVVVENSPVGIQAAKSAGMFVIALKTTLSEYYLSGADLILESTADLLKIIKINTQGERKL